MEVADTQPTLLRALEATYDASEVAWATQYFANMPASALLPELCALFESGQEFPELVELAAAIRLRNGLDRVFHAGPPVLIEELSVLASATRITLLHLAIDSGSPQIARYAACALRLWNHALDLVSPSPWFDDVFVTLCATVANEELVHGPRLAAIRALALIAAPGVNQVPTSHDAAPLFQMYSRGIS